MATAVKRKPTKAVKAGGGTFRVLGGNHWDKGPVGCECVECDKSSRGMIDRIAKDGIQKDPKDPTFGFDPATGRDAKGRAPQHKYSQATPTSPDGYDNDIIESDTDLMAKFNTPISKKFERIDASGQSFSQLPKPIEIDDKLSIRQLLAIAEDEEIDLKGVDTTKKADIIKAIRGA